MATEGCFYWGFFVQCYFQLYLITPLLFILYKKLPVAFWLLMVTFVGISISYWIYYCLLKEFTVGLLSFNNYEIFDILFRRPWAKLEMLAYGFAFATFYFRLLKYRKLRTDEERKTAHHVIYFLH